MNKILKSLLIVSLLVIVSVLIINNQNKEPFVAKGKAIVYKSPTCGCCRLYADYLAKKGFEVEVNDLSNLSEIKAKYNIPLNMSSCHTTIISDYFIEGHIPVEVIDKVLAEKPQINGIALPDMPSGSPGMPGAKTGPFEISQQGKDGSWSPYLNY